MSPRDEDPILPGELTDARRPQYSEIAEVAAQAIAGATPVQEALVTALLRYLEITGVYVRSGLSSSVMQEAFDAGVAAIHSAAKEK